VRAFLGSIYVGLAFCEPAWVIYESPTLHSFK
jgi:hypothetical protein